MAWTARILIFVRWIRPELGREPSLLFLWFTPTTLELPILLDVRLFQNIVIRTHN